MNVSKLKIDPKCLGEKIFLTEIVPVYEYKDQKRTKNVQGFRYVVALAAHGLEKIGVKIDGEQQIDAPEEGTFKNVAFDGLDIRIYEIDGKVQVVAKADKIRELKA